MAVIVRFSGEVVQVVPGEAASLDFTIRNTGTVVDLFRFEVLGDAAAWSTVDPPTLSLFPGAEGKATLRFAPPRLASIPAGPVAFGLRAESQEDPAGSSVEEGTVEVAAFADTFIELLPRTSTGRTSASHEVAVDNRGNARVNATVTGADPDKLLTFDIAPPAVVVEPGTAAFARVRVTPRTRLWRGQPKTRPFKLQVEAPPAAPMTLDGTLLQQSILPSWFGRALAACLALAILAALLWFGLVRPAITSAAQQALADAGITPKPSGAAALTPTPPLAPTLVAPTPAGPSTTPPLAPTLVAPTPAGPSATPGATATPFPVAGTPVDGRLTYGGFASTPTVPAGTTLYVTDLIFSNTQALSGTATLARGPLVIAQLQLDSYRELDYHFVTPIVVKAGQKLTFAAECITSGLATPGPPCTPSVYYSGFTVP